jgi:excisionase family DNA binding protein
MQQNTSDQSLLVNLTEAGKLLSVSSRTIQNLVAAGRLRAVRVGTRGVRLSRADLEAFTRGEPPPAANGGPA